MNLTRSFILAALPQLLYASLAFSDAPPKIRFYTVRGSTRELTTMRYLGDKTAVHVDGLAPNTTYSIQAVLNYGDQKQSSVAAIQSDATGVIDTEAMPAVAGSYTDADADGLFWSMKADPKPIPQAPSVYRISVQKSGDELQSSTLTNGFLKPGVRQISLSGTGMVGVLFLPDTDQPRPAVIAYSGSEGGLSVGAVNAAALANEGFVGLGLAYFCSAEQKCASPPPGFPTSLAKIPLEYFQKAIQYLQSRPEVQKEKLAVMGPSRGGELSLLLGSVFPEIKAVVAMVPSPMRWAANDNSDESGHPNPAWILHGADLPFLETSGDLVPALKLPDGRVAFSNRPAFEKGMQDPFAIGRAMSAIEKTNGPILLLGGDDDQVWPSCDLAKMALQRLKDKSHPFPDQAICYPHAGHMGIGIPGLSTQSTVAWHPQMQRWLTPGGTPEGNAAAQRKSWARILKFLKATFQVPGTDSAP